jgi:hypothetical protein
LNFSMAYHPHTDGQTERTNQVLEDMLRACALQHVGSWNKSLPYAEFSYNNSYQATLKMSPFEALYGRKCRTPLYWDQTGERQFFGPELIQEAEEQVRIIRENLRVAQTRQNSYADNRRRPLEFEGDYVMCTRWVIARSFDERVWNNSIGGGDDVHGPTTALQRRCALATDTPPPMAVTILWSVTPWPLGHSSCKQSKN